AQAQARGLRAIVADTAENLAAAPDIAGTADEAVELAYDDPDRCVEWALERARAEPLAGVYGFREFSVESVARVAAALGLPGHPPDAVVGDRAELAQAYAALPEPDRGRFLVETHQTGAEYSAEGVFVDGVPHVVALTEKRLVGDGSVVELGHVLPARLEARAAARGAE